MRRINGARLNMRPNTRPTTNDHEVLPAAKTDDKQTLNWTIAQCSEFRDDRWKLSRVSSIQPSTEFRSLKLCISEAVHSTMPQSKTTSDYCSLSRIIYCTSKHLSELQHSIQFKRTHTLALTSNESVPWSLKKLRKSPCSTSVNCDDQVQPPPQLTWIIASMV